MVGAIDDVSDSLSSQPQIQLKALRSRVEDSYPGPRLSQLIAREWLGFIGVTGDILRFRLA